MHAFPAEPTTRYDRLDALRGVAMLWMAAFHLAFDLNHFGFIHQDFNRDPLWTWQRVAIVSLFLLCAGVGQAIALAHGQSEARFWRRWIQVAGAAVLVSAGSWLMFPRSFIFFGVLHGIALMLIISRYGARAGGWLWPIGLGVIALPLFFNHPFFDSRMTAWIGLVTRKPITEDFVPLIPWLGVMLWGVAAGRWLLCHRPQWLTRLPPVPALTKPLAALGRWPLSFYLLHQPVLIGLVLVARQLQPG